MDTKLVIVKFYCGNLGSSRNPKDHLGEHGNWNGNRARSVAVIAKAVHKPNGFDNFWYFWAELTGESSDLPHNHAADFECEYL
jgi:hypothetical protein